MMDYIFDWVKYPELAKIFEHRPKINKLWVELTQLLRDARADAVRFIEDAKAEELQKSYLRGLTDGRNGL
jgi:hypothetical protein